MPADDLTSPVLEGVPLEQHAGVTVALAEGFPLDEVLGNEGLPAPAWLIARTAWKQRLATEGTEGPLFGAFRAKRAEAEDWLARPVAPIDRDLGAWMSFLAAFSASPDGVAMLEGKGLTMNDQARLQRAWSKKLEADEALRKKAAEIARKGPGPLPPLRIEPATLKPFPWWGMNGVMTIINVLLVISIWESSPKLEDWGVTDVADFGASLVSVANSAAAAAARTRFGVGLLRKLVDAEGATLSMGLFAGAVALVDGVASILKAVDEHDPWMFTTGVLQVGSGLLIICGVWMGIPGAQLAGVVVGVVATAVQLIKAGLEDSLEQLVRALIKQLRELKTLSNGTPIVDNIGVGGLLKELEDLVKKCDVGVLVADVDWRVNGDMPAEGRIRRRLQRVGIGVNPNDWRALTALYVYSHEGG